LWRRQVGRAVGLSRVGFGSAVQAVAPLRIGYDADLIDRYLLCAGMHG
jgi:hypothetical protein